MENRFHPIAFVFAGVIGFLVCGAWTMRALSPKTTVSERTEDDDVQRILEELDATRFPTRSTSGDDEAVARFEARVRSAAERIVELTYELERRAPSHVRLVEWLDKRWALLVNTLHRSSDVLRETESRTNDLADVAHREARLARAEAALDRREIAYERREEWVAAAQASGADPVRVGMAWIELASSHASSLEAQRIALSAAQRCETSSPHVDVPRKALETRLAWSGRELALELVDPRNDRALHSSSLAGRSVLLVVWSGESSATRNAIEGALRLRDDLGPERLTVIGMHEWRIDGGWPALKTRLRELGFEVPHHYEEPKDPWSGRVRELGVRQVPTLFLLDAEGRVVLSSQTIEGVEPALRASAR